MIKFAINGFGRIGRTTARIWLERFMDQLDLVAVNTSGSLTASGWAYLLQHDTAYRTLPFVVEGQDTQDPKAATAENPLIGFLLIHHPKGELKIPVLAQRDPSLIPWGKLGADIIVEATGVFRTEDQARLHIGAGAKMVVISAPAKGDGIPTAVIGVNDDQVFHKENLNKIGVISNASCTTNSVAPVASIMHEKLGVKKAMLLTVHGYTDDQNLQDNSHKDLRRARAAAQNIVPTSTGAAIATTETIPALKGLFDGIAVRVPVITGSLTDFTFITQKTTSVEEVNQMFIDAARSPQYKGILAVTEEALVSSDIIGRPESSIVDLGMTRVVDGDMVKVMAWYDNEWGYTNRLVEQVIKAGENLL